MCPIVPMFTCGLLSSNFSLAIAFFRSSAGAKIKKPVTRLSRDSAGALGNDFVGNGRGRFGVMRKGHGEASPALRADAQIGGIAKHLRQRHLAANNLSPGARLHA